MQNRMSVGDLLDSAGRLVERGWATEEVRRYARGAVTAGPLRIKEWNYYCILTDDYGLALTVADNDYVGFLGATWLDFRRGAAVSEEALLPLPMGKLAMPESANSGDVAARHSKLSIAYRHVPGGRRVSVDAPGFDKGRGLKGELFLAQPPMDRMVIATPFADAPKAFYYNQKINCLRAEGAVEFGHRRALGLLVKLFGDHNAIFADLMKEFGETGRFDYRHASGIVVTAFISLIAGASLGPEAPLADACGGRGTWVSDKLKLDERETRTMGYSGLSAMLAAFITNPFGGALLSLESAQGGFAGLQMYFWGLFPTLLASATATVTFAALSGQFFASLYEFPNYLPTLKDLFLAVPLGLIGSLAGLLFVLVFRWLARIMEPLTRHLTSGWWTSRPAG